MKGRAGKATMVPTKVRASWSRTGKWGRCSDEVCWFLIQSKNICSISKRPQLSLTATSQSSDVIWYASTCTAVAIRLGAVGFLISHVRLRVGAWHSMGFSKYGRGACCYSLIIWVLSICVSRQFVCMFSSPSICSIRISQSPSHILVIVTCAMLQKMIGQEGTRR